MAANQLQEFRTEKYDTNGGGLRQDEGLLGEERENEGAPWGSWVSINKVNISIPI